MNKIFDGVSPELKLQKNKDAALRFGEGYSNDMDLKLVYLSGFSLNYESYSAGLMFKVKYVFLLL